mgnify:FL=1
MRPDQIRQAAAEIAESVVLRAAEDDTVLYLDTGGEDREQVRAELRVIAEQIARAE